MDNKVQGRGGRGEGVRRGECLAGYPLKLFLRVRDLVSLLASLSSEAPCIDDL